MGCHASACGACPKFGCAAVYAVCLGCQSTLESWTATDFQASGCAAPCLTCARELRQVEVHADRLQLPASSWSCQMPAHSDEGTTVVLAFGGSD